MLSFQIIAHFLHNWLQKTHFNFIATFKEKGKLFYSFVLDAKIISTGRNPSYGFFASSCSGLTLERVDNRCFGSSSCLLSLKCCFCFASSSLSLVDLKNVSSEYWHFLLLSNQRQMALEYLRIWDISNTFKMPSEP